MLLSGDVLLLQRWAYLVEGTVGTAESLGATHHVPAPQPL